MTKAELLEKLEEFDDETEIIFSDMSGVEDLTDEMVYEHHGQIHIGY